VSREGGGGPTLYTRTGDRGTTSLLAGGRVRKDHPAIECNGAIDEAQAFLGAARAACAPDDPLGALLVDLERDLWIAMAEVATAVEHRARLRPGETAVTAEMVRALEERIDAALGRGALARAFAVPGENRLSAALDVARAVVRRAERLAVGLELPESFVVAYLNRLSDLCWALARTTESEHRVQRRDAETTEET
jgi:cob(I)alamin adenosyltransferase